MGRKMALVPAEMATHYQLELQKPGVPALAQLSSLDMQMKTILESKEMTDEMKFQKYYSTLRQYEAMQQEGKTVVPVAAAAVQPVQLPLPEHELLEAVPKPQQRGAKILLKYMQENPDIQWNQQKELVYKGTRIPNSNVISLVSDISRNRKNATLPTGWQEFAMALAEQNIPIEAIGNKQRWAFMHKPPTAFMHKSPTDESSEYVTEQESFRESPMLLESLKLSAKSSTPKRRHTRQQRGKGKCLIWKNLY